MSSLVIGLDISDSHITAALVRIDRVQNLKLSIEQDTYYTRLYEIKTETDPREIISIWIECINDLLLDFSNHYHAGDQISGISIGIPGPMDYQSGVSHIRSPMLNKFFGLNLRLAIQSGLRDLVSRWKKDFYRSSRRTTLTPSTTAYISTILNIPIRTIEEFREEEEFSRPTYSRFCGLHDKLKSPFEDEDETRPSIPQSHRGTYFHDIILPTIREFSSVDRFNSQLWSMIERLPNIPITFSNDARCFALGEITNDYNQGYERILALTLGTNFGSAFLDQGEIITNREDVPPDGTLWNCPYDQHSIADDWFSIRGLINIYRKLLRHESPDDSSGTSSMTLSTDESPPSDEIVRINNTFLLQRASNGDANAIKAFHRFARLLGQFLIPYINGFHAELITIAGDLTQAWYLLEEELTLTIQKFSKVDVYFSLSQGKSISLGAVQQQLSERPKNLFRDTDQPLLPVVKTAHSSNYDLYPTHPIPIGYIGIGYRTLNEKLFQLIEENEILLIDGFVGTYFDQYARQLNQYSHRTFQEKNLSSSLLFYDSRTFLQTDANLQREIILQDPKTVFGRLQSDLEFVDCKKLEFFKSNLSYPCVIIGPASSYVHETCPLVYIDLPKNELYQRIAAQSSFSYLKPTRRLKSQDDYLTPAMYERKCLHYLDYPVFNKLKQELLPRMNYFIDGQRPNCPTWIEGETFRQALVHLSNQPIRLRPWFESGPPGGLWLKTKCTNLSETYSRAHEMVTSENGLILTDVNDHLIEFSWDIFYASQANRILGNDLHYRLFSGGNDFPIRLSFLDTIDGENSPIQCTPNLSYIRTNFGEKFTQDEAYYIIETRQHRKEEYHSESYLYLGFHENINPDEFHHALMISKTNKINIDIEKYVQGIATNIHELFLIPNETIYASGPNQVILEISTTPYIYRFKLYDWLRLDRDGRLRLLNIEHGIKNLKFHRRAKQLRCQPISLQSEEDKYEEQYLPTHALHYYDVHRLIIEPNENIEIIRYTENRFHLCMLVEGDAIEIEYDSMDNRQEKQIRQYNYIESFLIPASISEYRLRPIIKNKNQSRQFILLITFLKWNCEQLFE